MNGRDITALGYREGPLVGLALRIAKRAIKRQSRAEVDEALKAILATPEAYASDSLWGDLAAALIKERDRPYWIEREAPAPYRVWGEGLEKGALDQMATAARLPVAVRGALMPDAHQGYGLPIGGGGAKGNSGVPPPAGGGFGFRRRVRGVDIP